jgi:primosomal protein N' (replication factor Y)
MFVEIYFPLPFRKPFTYFVPKELEQNVKVGVRAVAPFGKRVITGFITKITDKTDLKEKIKNIQDVIDDIPVFDEKGFKFYEWLAEYYLCSTGEALNLSVPYGTEIQSKKKISADTEFCKKLLEKESKKNSIKYKLLSVFSEEYFVSLSRLQKLTGRKNLYAALSSLEQDGAITVHTEIDSPKVREKKAKFIKLAKTIDEIYEVIPELESRSPKQVEVLLKLLPLKKKDILLAQFLKENKVSLASIESLAKKGIVSIFLKQVERKFIETYTEEINNFKLTDAQENVINEVSGQINKKEFKTYLLHGVTGSGKTQVYIELIKKVLAQNKTALILVPEISLTPQITSRLINNFGESVSVIHSKMPLGERYDSWQKILRGKSNVVIGARSALFAPLRNIGLIVVDEEHDASYKQDDLPKYNGKDAAIVRAKFSDCPVVLGTATPSVESMFNVTINKFHLLSLPERVDDAKLPVITLVDVIAEKKKKRMENIFSQTLLEKIDSRLKKKEGVIILQNRRGFATQIYCIDCGQIESCDNCSVSMVYHINENILHCHYCGFTKKVPPVCSHCGSPHLKYFGTGTERVEDELAYYFPNINIERVDSDSITKKGTLSSILQRFKNGETDILVGTQMVAKGLDFSRVTLVGVISAETSLWFPDFRADERTFQLLTQVSGRAGRSKVEGEVVIQTQNEKHFVLQRVLDHDYAGFYKKEITDRERMGYPPFTRICLIETKDKDDNKAKGAITDFYNEIAAYKKYVTVSPPSTAIIAKLKGDYRYNLLIKSSRATDAGGSKLRKAILESYSSYNRKSRFRDVKLSIDIDPQSII